MVNNRSHAEYGGATVNQYHHLIGHIQDAVVRFELVDGDPIVRDVNKAFVEIFGYSHEEVQGEPLNEWIVPDWLLEEARSLDAQTATGEVNYQRVRRETTSGLREFLYRGIPYGDDTAQTGGFAVYTDLTEITRNERRLQVMNRVLRHNLRNKANIIAAHTTQLLDELDEQATEQTPVAATIEKAAHDLATIAQEAGDIHALLNSSDGSDTVIDCVPLIQSLVEEYRQRSPMATIETNLPESMEVKANRRLQFAIDSLIDNAIQHNPTDTPRVRIRVDEAEADGWVDLYVDDDGPRIPADERSVITGEAEITPTRHGSGLGLWLVKWTTELFGGELSFARSDLGGNSVHIRLPKGDSTSYSEP